MPQVERDCNTEQLNMFLLLLRLNKPLHLIINCLRSGKTSYSALQSTSKSVDNQENDNKSLGENNICFMQGHTCV